MQDLGYLAQDISILHRQYYKDTSEQFYQLNLNPTAACILLTINDHEHLNQSQIARELVLDKGMVTRQIKKLRTQELVQTTPQPGKALEVQLTTTGRKILTQVQTIRRQWWSDRFIQNGIQSDAPLIASIEKVVANIVHDDNES